MAMLLQQLSEHTYYIPGSNNLGVITTPEQLAIVVDTGIDKETGRLIRKALDEAKLKLAAIINTHHHADHIGGNDFLVRNIPGIEVLAPPLEAALIEYPLLEPVYLSMGAQPIAALQTKWLMAKGVPVTRLITGTTLEVAGISLEVLGLAGHSLGQIGIVYEGVAFVADGFFGPVVLAKHGVPYAQEIAGQLRSLDTLAARSEALFVPGHGEVATQASLPDVLAANRAAIEKTSSVIVTALNEPAELSTIGRRVQHALALQISGIPQYAIFLSAISAHLAYLETQGRARVELSEAGMVWRAV
jgi:glyoxylase-like metal-dependent hydrolase (beta-lactamase superfamily II)